MALIVALSGSVPAASSRAAASVAGADQEAARSPSRPHRRAHPAPSGSRERLGGWKVLTRTCDGGTFSSLDVASSDVVP
jgi:hypothetical protein